MWQEIFSTALGNGLLSALFVALLIYVLRDTAKREQKYQEIEEENRSIIARLTEGLRVVSELKVITEEIHKKVFDTPAEEKTAEE
jgi:hypothetical protein